MKRASALELCYLGASLALALGCTTHERGGAPVVPTLCDLHQVVLVEAEVPVTYGLPSRFWVDRARSSFPNAPFVFGGCVTSGYGPKVLPKPICSGCEKAWRFFQANYKAERSAWERKLDEELGMAREFGETLAEAERRPEDREAGPGDNRTEDSPSGD